MRSVTTIILAFSMLLLLACSSGTTITNTITQTQTETQQAQEVTTTVTTTQPTQTITDTITSTMTNTMTSTITIATQPPMTTETITTTATTTVTTTTTSTTTPEVESVQLISETDLGDGNLCYLVKVECLDLAPREAEIRASPNPDSKGTVIFLGGGWGKGWYGDASEHHIGIINGMRDEGYETYEIRWLGEQGWGTDNFGQGIKKLTGATTDVIRWIVNDIANNRDVVGATGHSGGANWLAYGLAIHGFDDILDVVVLSSGPAWTDLTTLCDIGMPFAKFIVDYCMGWLDSGDYCQGEERPEWVIQALQEQSIVSSVPGESRDYHYPATKVVFIEGELDEPAMVNGRVFYDAITSGKSWVVLEGVGHGVPSNPDGAAVILEMLLGGVGG